MTSEPHTSGVSKTVTFILYRRGAAILHIRLPQPMEDDTSCSWCTNTFNRLISLGSLPRFSSFSEESHFQFCLIAGWTSETAKSPWCCGACFLHYGLFTRFKLLNNFIKSRFK